MKKVNFKSIFASSILVISLIGLASCKKNKCTECHYDAPSGEVEIGERCGDDREDLEKNGYIVDGVKYEAHCGEH